MKIAIAQAYHGLHKQYKKELDKLGAQTRYFDIDSANWLSNALKKPTDAYLWHADAKDENYRVILDRIYFIEFLLKKPIFPDMNMYFAYNDKIKQADYFQYFKIPTLKTFSTYQKKLALNFVKNTKYPFVLKNIYSYGGKGVYKIENRRQAKDVVQKIFDSLSGWNNIKGYFYAQEFLADLEKDLRIITIGPCAKFAYWRINPNDWRHNIGRGGTISLEDIPQKTIQLCEKISSKSKFHWMAYDLFYYRGEPLLMEMACNFSTKGIEKLGFNVRGEMMKYLNNYSKKICAKK